MTRAAVAFAVGLLCASAALAQTSPFCPAYTASPIYRPRLRQVQANPSNWIGLIEGAQDGDEILLADGVYSLNQYAVQITHEITVRGASGSRAAVRIQGQGYGVGSEGFMVHARNVTIADLTMAAIRNHAISIKGESGAEAPHVYNVDLYDIGTQHIKGTPGDGVGDGVVACSRIGYSASGVRGDYINAIDIHRGINWSVRDNEIYNIWGDGTGCEVDVDCGTYLSGGGPAILFWNNSSGTVIERNRIVESFMGIAVGYGTPHPGGAIRNNFVFRSQASRPGARGAIVGDLGIHVRGGNGTTVDHNTVIQAGSYPGAIEIGQSQGVAVRNSLISQPVWDRGGNTGLSLQGNKTNGTAADLVAPLNPHLFAGSSAIDFPATVSLAGVPDDIDGDVRPLGVRRDAGCDEWKTCAVLPTGMGLFTRNPCRLVDTRLPPGPLGGPALSSGATRSFDLNQSCAVPATAKALSLNVTVTRPTGQGYVTLGAGGCPVPITSTINFSAGQTRANNAIATLAADGSGNLLVFATVAGSGSVDLILDVNGYFE